MGSRLLGFMTNEVELKLIFFSIALHSLNVSYTPKG